MEMVWWTLMNWQSFWQSNKNSNCSSWKLHVLGYFRLLQHLFSFFIFCSYNSLQLFWCRESLISNCPVCGENLGKFDRMNAIIHLTLCFDEGTGNQVMTGGFLTDKQASYGWETLTALLQNDALILYCRSFASVLTIAVVRIISTNSKWLCLGVISGGV